MFKRQLPERIIRARRVLDLNQKQLAERADIAPSTVNEIEGGFGSDLRVSTLLKFCKVLRVTPNYLLGFEKGDLVGRCPRSGSDPPPHLFSPELVAISIRAERDPALPCGGECFCNGVPSPSQGR